MNKKIVLMALAIMSLLLISACSENGGFQQSVTFRTAIPHPNMPTFETTNLDGFCEQMISGGWDCRGRVTEIYSVDISDSNNRCDGICSNVGNKIWFLSCTCTK